MAGSRPFPSYPFLMTRHPNDPCPSRAERWNARLGSSNRAQFVLFWASVAETLLVPIPIEVIMVPFMLANRARIWLTAAVVLAGNLAASLVGYAIGYYIFESFGLSLVERFGWGDAFAEFQPLFADHGFWAIVAIGIIPIPFQIAMLVAGAAKYPLIWFVAAAAVARGVRYFGLGLLVYHLGDQAMAFWKRHKVSATIGATLAVGAFFLATNVTGGA